MMIVPEVTDLTHPYWDGAKVGELRLQWCEACGAVWHPPQPVCPTCQSRDVVWRAAGGLGRVYSYTVVSHAAHPAVADKVPYTLVLVTLEEGPRVLANLLAEPEQARVDLPVRLRCQRLAHGLYLPQFELL